MEVIYWMEQHSFVIRFFETDRFMETWKPYVKWSSVEKISAKQWLIPTWENFEEISK